MTGRAIDNGIADQTILDALLGTYYQSDAPEAGASSHWRHYSPQSQAVQDLDGRLVGLVGVGFGQATWSGSGDRALDQLCIAAHLVQLGHRRRIFSFLGRLRTVCRAMGTDPTMDAFRQACTLELLDRHVPHASRQRLRLVIIGDGQGALAALAKSLWPRARITLIDLGRTLLFQALHCQKAYPQSRHVLVTENAPHMVNADFVYCAADQVTALEGETFDLAVNVASMQEMTATTVAEYFAFLRRRLSPAGLFYCCNRQRKVLPDGEVSSFAHYPWNVRDRVLVDGPCPWHQYFVSPSRTAPKLTIGGVPVPLFRRYDGPHVHRLAALAVGTN